MLELLFCQWLFASHRLGDPTLEIAELFPILQRHFRVIPGSYPTLNYYSKMTVALV